MGIIPFPHLTTCQFRGLLPQLHLKGDSMKPMPKVMDNGCPPGTHQERASWKRTNSLVTILRSLLQHFSASLIKQVRSKSSPCYLSTCNVSVLMLGVCPNVSYFIPTTISKSNKMYEGDGGLIS